MTSPFRTCYRHPDQPAGVVCQRCNRPICPRCMNQAAVGFQCPECVRATGQRVYTARSLWAAQQPVMTYVLVALNVAVYLYGLALGGGTGGRRLSGCWPTGA